MYTYFTYMWKLTRCRYCSICYQFYCGGPEPAPLLTSHMQPISITPTTGTYSQCVPRTHLNDLWSNTCGLLLVGVAHALGTVDHVQQVWEGWQSVCWKSLRMWPQLWTTLNVRIWSFLKTAMHFLCFANRCSSLLCSLFLTQSSRGCGCIYALCICFHFRASLLALSSSLMSQFLPFWCRDNETASAATAENDKLV